MYALYVVSMCHFCARATCSMYVLEVVCIPYMLCVCAIYMCELVVRTPYMLCVRATCMYMLLAGCTCNCCMYDQCVVCTC